MLNRPKLLKELENISGKLFADFSDEFSIARESWQRIAADPTFLYKIQALHTSLPLPTWNNHIDETFSISQSIDQYSVIAIDGSQIYPDKHQGTTCFLLNIGSVILNYGNSVKPVILDSIPRVFLGDEDKIIEYSTPDYINLRREQMEFECGLESAQRLDSNLPTLLLWDGSLIFWHLESKDPKLRSEFLSRYFRTLQQLYEHNIINASYLSLPKNRELVNLLKVELSGGNPDDVEIPSLSHILDVHIVNFFLNPEERTTVFKHRSKTANYYPEPLKPYFFYLHTAYEIVRIELPAWLAHNEETISLISRIIYDQSIKGRGYPVALAEAHEQAVVKGPDRDLFYHLINKLGMNNKHHSKISQKLLKKRSIGI